LRELFTAEQIRALLEGKVCGVTEKVQDISNVMRLKKVGINIKDNEFEKVSKYKKIIIDIGIALKKFVLTNVDINLLDDISLYDIGTIKEIEKILKSDKIKLLKDM
jgi:hypothetical protein